MMILPVIFEKIESIDALTLRSDTEKLGTRAFVLSDKRQRTPSFP